MRWTPAAERWARRTTEAGTRRGAGLRRERLALRGEQDVTGEVDDVGDPHLSLIHISEPTRLLSLSYAVSCLNKTTTPTTLGMQQTPKL